MDEQGSDYEKAVQEMREFEQSDELPADLSDWPSGKAKYITFGEDSDEGYGDGVTGKLGPAEVAHHDDGSVTVGGEPAEASDFKGEPTSGGMIEQIEQSKQRYREMLEENPDLRRDEDA